MSKITLVFEGETHADVKAQVEEYLASTGGAKLSGSTTVPAVSAPANAAPAAAKEGGKSATKGKKDNTATPVAAAPAQDEAAGEEDANPFDTDEEAEPEGEALTYEVVTAKLKEVGDKLGVPKVRDVLKAAGAPAKIKELKEAHFEKVMAACKKALA